MDTPDFLYKYRGFDAYSLSSLANQTIWLSRPSSFNDPFDCAITLDQGLYKESITHAITESLKINGSANNKREKLSELWPGDKEAFDEYRNGIRKILQNMGVCSFSETADTLLLWSHYADHHKGFCIEYDCSEESNLRRKVRKVMYSDSVPKVSAADITGQNRDEVFDMLWLTKAKCWKYEKEWRLLGSEGGMEIPAPSRISSIIFGARMAPQQRLTIMNMLQYDQNIIYKEAVLSEDEFRLEIRMYGNEGA